MWIQVGEAKPAARSDAREAGPAASPDACPLGFALAGGFAAAAGGCLLAAAAAPPHEPTTRLVVLTLTVALFSVSVRNVTAAVLTAGIAWSLYLGFLVGQAGELHWHGSVDLLRLGTLTVAALVGSARWPITDLAGRRPVRPDPPSPADDRPPERPPRRPSRTAPAPVSYFTKPAPVRVPRPTKEKQER